VNQKASRTPHAAYNDTGALSRRDQAVWILVEVCNLQGALVRTVQPAMPSGGSFFEMICNTGSFAEGALSETIGMFLAQWVYQRAMEPVDESFEAENHEDASEEPAPIDWVPDLAERQETLKRANEALERARTLLEHVNHLERSKIKNPAIE
jgi:hypothetical protein